VKRRARFRPERDGSSNQPGRNTWC